jgi:hypothetical protein
LKHPTCTFGFSYTRHVKGEQPGSSGGGGISQEWIKKGAFVNVLETANVEPGLGKIWKVHHVSSSSDVVKFVDIKRVKNTPILKTINSTG